jgi:predicted Ser/Thr protein kinase
MPDAPADFTQTVASSVTTSSRASSSSHEHIEGRFAPGTLLNGRYRIIALLGKGGMGEVYRATDLTLGQSVALKFLPALGAGDPRLLERFHNEVRIARQVSHPNVCRVYDIGEAEGLVYLSMEYVDGEDLSTLLKRIGRLPSEKATEIARKICAGLAAAHDRGVIHRDLKPHNVMLDKRGEVLICDFGLAALPEQINPAEFRQGTPAYMAPEQIKGTSVTAQSDIYALGLVLYELYTGKRPYSGKNVQEILVQQEAMAMTSMTSHAQDIDPTVENIIKRCLDPEPSTRPSSALLVSIALPGGDPLAAALAAGQTPSPELVAASKSQGLRLRYSLPLLLFVIVGVLAYPLLNGQIDALQYTPADLPPGALEVQARRVAASFGYTGKPVDSIWWLTGIGDDVIKRASANFAKPDWYAVFREEAPLRFRYREAANDTLGRSPIGDVRWDFPSFEAPSMVRLMLDPLGRLRYFEAMPPRDMAQKRGPGVSFESIAELTQFQIDRRKPVPPFRTPTAAYDEIHAFEAVTAGAMKIPIKIQYSAHRGYLTSLHVQYPWTTIPPAQLQTKPLSTRLREGFLVGAMLVFFFYCFTLAWRNWKGGRADRKGAFTLAAAYLILQIVAYLGTLHVTYEVYMIYFFVNALSDMLTSSAMIFLLYLALEPALRARWPQAIVTWNRLLAGRILDPQVGAHILTGAAMGVFLVSFFLCRSWYEYWSSGRLNEAGSLMLGGVGNWIGQIARVGDSSMQAGMIIFFALFGLKVLLKRDWLVVLLGSVVLPVQESSLAASNQFWLDYPLYVLVYAIIFVALLRFGLLSGVFCLAFTNALGRAASNNDFTAWYMAGTVAIMILLIAIALFAFWRSLGDQKLVGGTT